MNIKALITSLVVLGSSSVAMARPVTYSASVDASWSLGYTAPVVRDHRTTRPVIVQPARMPVSFERDSWNNNRWEHTYQPRPQMLASDLTFLDSEYRKDILVGSDKGRFNTITIEANGGRTYVMKVGIEFTDGTIQPIEVNRTLRGGQGMTIDLDRRNRSISRIFIYRADGPAALNMNVRHYGEFLVTAL
ncbi:MAG: hypothetical protein H6Q90_2418 [Deltaproteobacteria bacterium]|nr:hypothetical protein [Deltaproteobacteria bacterium]